MALEVVVVEGTKIKGPIAALRLALLRVGCGLIDPFQRVDRVGQRWDFRECNAGFAKSVASIVARAASASGRCSGCRWRARLGVATSIGAG